jgi:hypothetical protein
MVPSLERPEYMYELRQIADNIVREQCKHSELHSDLHFPKHTEAGAGYKAAEGSEFVESPVDAASKDSPSPAGESHVGPAFHIPMTQEKSLEDLPSQMDFDWQESATPCPSPVPTTARSLVEELDVVGTPAIVAEPPHVEVHSFVEVSQIAQEAVMDAAQQETPTRTSATTTSIAGGSLV